MYRDKFVVSIIHNGNALRESGPPHNRRVTIPFNEEYKIRIRNRNPKSAAARVFIDGTNISSFGDLVVSANGVIDLERFITESMSQGERFKFVPLNHRDVADPGSSSNGIIKVEFRMESFQPYIVYSPYPLPVPPSDIYYGSSGGGTGDIHWIFSDNSTTWNSHIGDETIYSSKGTSAGNLGDSSFRLLSKKSSPRSGMQLNSISASVSPGATVGGGTSNQNFGYTQMQFESTPSTIIKLKLVGVSKEDVSWHKKPKRVGRNYCYNCGAKIQKRSNFCPVCGAKL